MDDGIKDYKNKLANKIVDKDYQNTNKKNPFTQAAEKAKDLLAYKYNSTTGTFRNSDGQTAKDMGQAVKSNELFDKNFQDQKRDDYIAKFKHPNYSNNPTVNRYKNFKENKQRKLDDKKFQDEYSDKSIEQHVRKKEHQNKKDGRPAYENFSASDIVVAEHAKDKARKKLAAIKTENIKIEPTYIDYRLNLKDPTPTISLEEHMAQSAPREIDPLGITGLAEVKDYKRSFDTANRNFNLRSSNGVAELLGEYDES